MTRAPVSLAKLAVVAELGPLLDVEVGVGAKLVRVRPTGGALLCWAPEALALVFVTGVKPSRPRSTDTSYQRAARAREQWLDDGRVADRVRVLRLPSCSGDWRRLGLAESIGYKSDKFGEAAPVAYSHLFTSRVATHVFESDKYAIWVLRGGALRVTKRGIEG